MKKGMCLETFSKPSDYSVLIPTSLDVGNKKQFNNRSPQIYLGDKTKAPLPKRFPSPPFPAPLGAGKGGEFVRYIIYAVLNPTPKGVGYDLDVHFTFFHSL